MPNVNTRQESDFNEDGKASFRFSVANQAIVAEFTAAQAKKFARELEKRALPLVEAVKEHAATVRAAEQKVKDATAEFRPWLLTHPLLAEPDAEPEADVG